MDIRKITTRTTIYPAKRKRGEESLVCLVRLRMAEVSRKRGGFFELIDLVHFFSTTYLKEPDSQDDSCVSMCVFWRVASWTMKDDAAVDDEG